MMSNRFGKNTVWLGMFAAVTVLSLASSAQAQFGGVVQQIGGISVNPSGALVHADRQQLAEARQQLLKDLANQPAEAREASTLRVISLKQLEAALATAIANDQELPDEIKYMAGIQRLQYVIAQPENDDILLAGPGEGWTVDEAGNVVGETTGRPVIRFEDFIVALRTADDANRDYGISVSINPTRDGLARYSELKTAIRRQGQGFHPDMKQHVEEAMGPQDISLTGLPADTRMAQVLVAADYHMKRLAMGLEAPAIEGLPSVLEIARQRRKGMNGTPRFWLECSYDSIKRSEDGLTWEISGPGAKALTENEVITASGKTKTVKDDPTSIKWAEVFTEKFGELANADPVFAELQNVMDMAVVAAIIEKHGLLETINLQAPFIQGNNDQVELPKWSVPSTVSTECSFVQIRNSWMVTASGGVQVDSWGVLENVEIDDSVTLIASTAGSARNDSAWWNAR